MTELYDYERFGVPEKKGGRYFYTRNDGLQNQSVLFVRDGRRRRGPRQLIDPNGWSADGATALAEWRPERGRQASCSIRSRTAAPTGARSGDRRRHRQGRRRTRSNGSNSRASTGPRTAAASIIRASPSPAGQAFQSLNENQQVYFHKLGTAQSSRPAGLRDAGASDYGHGARVSDDGSKLADHHRRSGPTTAMK